MKWFASYISILLPLGIVLIIGSFVRGRLWMVKPHKVIFLIGLVLLFAGVIGVIQVIRNPPGQVETVDEEEQNGPHPRLPDSALERLRLEWDSEAAAAWPVSETLADISEIAYQPPYEAEQSFRVLGFTNVMPVVQSSMIGYVVTGEDVTVVVFRGTDFHESSDWLANLGTSAISTPHGPVHRGFYNAYQSMKSQVDEILKDRDTTHLWVTGHSLGGALALVCAYDLEDVEQRLLDGVITFGQPMVARKEFADYIDKLLVGRYARFVNRDDIVPKVPPSHVPCGSLVWFTDSGVKRSKVRQIRYGAAAPNDSPIYDILVGDAGKDAEIKPLTDAEFEALQTKLKVENAEAEQMLEEEPLTYGAAAPSFVEDHSMILYVERIHMLLGVNRPSETQ